MMEKSPKHLERHGLTAPQMKRLPELLATPALVVKSASSQKSIVCVLPIKDADGAPIVAAIRVKDGFGWRGGVRQEANFVTSVYGKDHDFEGWLKAAAREGDVLYVDKKRSQIIMPEAGHPLPGTYMNIGSGDIIPPMGSNRKINEQGQCSPPLGAKRREVDKASRHLEGRRQETRERNEKQK